MAVVEEVYVSRDLSALKFREVSQSEVGSGPMLEEHSWVFVGYRVRSDKGELWLSKLGTPLSRNRRP